MVAGKTKCKVLRYDGSLVVLTVVDRDPPKRPGQVELAGWVGDSYISCIVDENQVEVIS